MPTCLLCARAVDRLHPVPPEVLTKELIGALDDGGPVVDLELCSHCIHALMTGASTADLAPAVEFTR